MPPREIFRQTSVGGAGAGRVRLVHRDPHRGLRRAPRAARSTPWIGSSHSSSPTGASARRFASASSGVRQAPLASTRISDVRADRGAHGGQPAGVVADPDLDLHAAEARPARRCGRGGRGAGAVVGADRGVDGDLVGGAAGGSACASGVCVRRDGVVPEREVDRRQRLREVALGAARGEHVGGRLDVVAAPRRRRRARSARRRSRRRRRAPAARPRPRRTGRRAGRGGRAAISRWSISPQDARSGARSAYRTVRALS